MRTYFAVYPKSFARLHALPYTFEVPGAFYTLKYFFIPFIVLSHTHTCAFCACGCRYFDSHADKIAQTMINSVTWVHKADLLDEKKISQCDYGAKIFPWGDVWGGGLLKN